MRAQLKRIVVSAGESVYVAMMNASARRGQPHPLLCSSHSDYVVFESDAGQVLALAILTTGMDSLPPSDSAGAAFVDLANRARVPVLLVAQGDDRLSSTTKPLNAFAERWLMQMVTSALSCRPHQF